MTEAQMVILIRAMQIRKKRGENVEDILEHYPNITAEEKAEILQSIGE